MGISPFTQACSCVTVNLSKSWCRSKSLSAASKLFWYFSLGGASPFQSDIQRRAVSLREKHVPHTNQLLPFCNRESSNLSCTRPTRSWNRARNSSCKESSVAGSHSPLDTHNDTDS